MDTTNEKYKRAKQRVDDVKGFYVHLFIYIVVNVFLFIMNVLLTPGEWWFYFPLIIWGVFGILFHFLEVFVVENKIFGKEWEEKKIKEYMDDD